MKVLDCSIRDGGHLNKWNFDPGLVIATYKAALKAGVDAFEIGYRYPKEMKDVGSFGHCTDEYIEELLYDVYDPKCELAVMIDTGKCEVDLFDERLCSPVTIVRVAAYPHELEKALTQVEAIHDLGYRVFLNPMVSSELTQEHFKILSSWKKKHILEAIYFADSFGTFTPDDIFLQADKFLNAGYKKIGFHAHNNLQLAVANALSANKIENVTWIDATVFGLGRGAGNAPIEIVLGLMNRDGRSKYDIKPYLNLVRDDYQFLKEGLDCTLTELTTMGGLFNVHPYYMDALAGTDLTVDKIWDMVEDIKKHCPITFDKRALDSLLAKKE